MVIAGNVCSLIGPNIASVPARRPPPRRAIPGICSFRVASLLPFTPILFPVFGLNIASGPVASLIALAPRGCPFFGPNIAKSERCFFRPRFCSCGELITFCINPLSFLRSKYRFCSCSELITFCIPRLSFLRSKYCLSFLPLPTRPAAQTRYFLKGF